MIGSIEIDDAGTPGVTSKSKHLYESRKSWAAVIVPDGVADEVDAALQIFIGGVNRDFGADELHFTDIYSARGPFKKVPVNKRVELFELMTSVFEAYQLPILYQTSSKAHMNDHSELIDQYCEACGSWWKLKKPAYFSLMFLCFRVAEFCRANRKQIAAPLRANIDEGLAKAGAIAQLPAFGDTFLNKELHFVRSVDHSRMQLADFAAFCISRSQWLMAKPDSRNPLAKGDRLFLEMASRLDVVNLNNITLNLKDHARADYDFMLSLDRIGKGLAPHPEE